MGAFARTISQDVGFGKLDYQLNATNHISASYDLLNYKGPNTYNTASTSANSSLTQNGSAVTHDRVFVANWDSTISPTMTNNFRFQWSRDL